MGFDANDLLRGGYGPSLRDLVPTFGDIALIVETVKLPRDGIATVWDVTAMRFVE